MADSARDPAPGEHHFTVSAEDAGQRLDLAVSRALGVSRTKAATWIAQQRVTVNGMAARASLALEPTHEVRVEVPVPEGRDVVAEQIPLHVVYEDDDLVVIDKPAGMVVHPAPGHWSGTLVNALLGRGGALSDTAGDDRPGLVHRLDKETSGLLVVAKHDAAHRSLSHALAQRTITRRYAALCWGHLDGDTVTVDKPLARDPRDRRRMAVVANGKAARTDFHRLARFDAVDLLRAHLHSGRTHQIRVHLQSIGHPVVGDDTYGGGGGRRLVALPPERHFLHAALLAFRHPMTGAALEFRAPLPTELRTSLVAVSRMSELATDEDPLARFGFYDPPVGAPGRAVD
ncbi:MAG: RluA family pseudouridine synthase [Gemmatimonadaceae bacterium]|jgi:23S rRNA pseudouridine1911/1915/1917 synthase|nr:RluA family pseudouridine synthase [Gemmatimonadaceae bacterium]